MSTPLMTPDLVRLEVDPPGDKHAVIAMMADLISATGRADRDGLEAGLLKREESFATGMPGGFAIPHCRTDAVHEAALGFLRLAEPVDFGSADGPADLIIGIAAPAGTDDQHLQAARPALPSPDPSRIPRGPPRRAGAPRGLRPGDGCPRARGGAAHRPRRSDLRRHGRRTPTAPAGMVAPQPPGCRWATRATDGRRERGARPARDHLLPHRDRPHLYGGRVARECREGQGRRAARRDPGLRRHHPLHRRSRSPRRAP